MTGAPTLADWLARAGALALVRNGGGLEGPCPACGGTDRFWVARDGKIGCRRCEPGKGEKGKEAYKAILESAGFASKKQAPEPEPRPAPAPRPPPDDNEPMPVRIVRASRPDSVVARRYLASRGAWPPDKPLPRGVRWIPVSAMRELGLWHIPDDAAGALCFKFGNTSTRTLDAVQLDALTADGRLTAPRWRRTFGAPAGAAFPALAPADDPGGPIHVAEGPVDALAIAWWRGRQAWSSGGTAGLLALAGQLAVAERQVTIEADGDGPGWAAAMKLQAALVKLGTSAGMKDWPACDPAEGLAAEWEERAAVLEYVAAMPRAEAETEAWKEMRPAA